MPFESVLPCFESVLPCFESGFSFLPKKKLIIFCTESGTESVFYLTKSAKTDSKRRLKNNQ
ncbi:hypothetical protein DV691_06395 [Salmonella enterica]|nr:hypothetical protein [Salmonella enterica]EBJ5219120.1 hypothetical protein [Salmonella enterica]EBM6614227.1 hypothetical protein [Salmonella enterica]